MEQEQTDVTGDAYVTDSIVRSLDRSGITPSDAYDRAWNDPPKFTYDAAQSIQMQPRKNVLNKRVAFPLDKSAAPSPTANKGSELPTLVSPPSVPSGLPIAQEIAAKSNELRPTNETPEHTLETVMQSLKDSIDGCGLQEREKADLTKRLAIFETKWGSFNGQLQTRLYDFCKAMDEKNFDKCDELHRSLVIDNTKELGSSLVALKKLIRSLQAIG